MSRNLKIRLTIISFLAFIFSLNAQVTGVKYKLVYDTIDCNFDVYIHITEGSAITLPHRAQFSAQMTIAVPKGSVVKIDSLFNPLKSIDNKPVTWSIATIATLCPDFDYYAITNPVGQAGFFSVLSQGDSVKLYDLNITPIKSCAKDIRFFINGYDPDSSDPCLSHGNFNNGYTIGGASQDYQGNLPAIFPPKAKITSENQCDNGINILVNADVPTCQDPVAYEWTGPTNLTYNVKNLILPATAPTGTYTLKVTDSYGCTTTKEIETDVLHNAGPDLITCANSSLNLTGTPNTGQWVQISGATGASLSATTSGNSTVTFANNANGEYKFAFVGNICGDTMSINVENQEAGPPPPFAPCFQDDEVILSGVGSGTWSLVAPFPAGATVFIVNVNDPNTIVKDFSLPGVYTFQWTNGSCSDKVTVNIGNACSCPIANNTISASPSEFCGSTNNILITGSNADPSGGQYKWEYSSDNGTSFGAASTASGSNTSKDYRTGNLTPGIHIFRRLYKVTSPVPCETYSENVIITVKAEPVIGNITANNPCEGDDLIISSSFVSGTYSWTGPRTSTDLSPIFTNATGTDAGTYTLEVTQDGCTSTKSISVNVRNNPVDPFIQYGDVCEGNQLDISVTLGAGEIYEWTTPNGGFIGELIQIPGATNAQHSGNYCVKATLNGCESPVVCEDITIKSRPQIPSPYSNSPICEGLDLELIAGTAYDPGTTFKWVHYNVSDVPTGWTSTLENPKIFGATVANSGRYELVVTNTDNCESEPSSAYVMVSSRPTTPSPSANEVCEGSPLTISANVFQAGISYEWTKDGVDIGNTTSSIDIISAGLGDSGKYGVKIVNGNCQSFEGYVDVIVGVKPEAPFVSNNGPLCPGAKLELITTDAGAGATYAWTHNNSSWTSTSKDPVIDNVDATHAGVYTVVAKLGNCESEWSNTFVDIKAKPATPSPSYNGPLCIGDNLQLNVNSVAGAAYLWTKTPWSTSEKDPEIGSVTLADAGTYEVKITVDGCESDKGSVNVIINNKPAKPSVSSNGPLCAGETLNLTTTAVATEYIWTFNGSFFSNDKNPVKNNVSTADAGTYELITKTNNCASEPSAINVVITNKPAAPVISGDLNLCSGSSLSLNVTSIPGATFSWTLPNTTTIVGEFYSVTSVNSSHAGTYKVKAKIGTCESAETSVNVVVKDKPNQPLLSSNEPCEGEDLNISSDITGVIYEWTKVGIIVSDKQNFIIPNSKASDAGQYTLVISKDGCKSNPVNVTAKVNPKPSAPVASSNSPVCEGLDIQLNASTVSGATKYVWTGPSFSKEEQNPKIISASLSNKGNYVVYVISDKGCKSENSTVNVDVTTCVCPIDNNTITLNNTSFCDKSGVQIITGSTPTPANGQYLWYESKDGIDYTVATGTNNVKDYITSDLTAGTYFYKRNYKTTSGIICDANTNVIVINVKNKPVITSNGNQEVCESDFVKIGVNSLTNSSYNWTFNGNPIAVTSNEITINNAKLTDAGFYEAKATVDGCESNFIQIELKVKSKPVLNNGSDVIVCEGTTAILKVDNIPGAVYLWDNGLTSNTYEAVVSNAGKTDEGIYKVSAIINGCQSNEAEVRLTIADQLVLTPGNDGNICEGENFTVQVNDIPGASYTWTKDDVQVLGNTTNKIELLSVKLSDEGSYKVKASLNGCESNEELIQVAVKKNPILNPLADDSKCEGESLILRANKIPSASYTWQKNTVNLGSSDTLKLNNLKLSDSGEYKVFAELNGCKSSSMAMYLNVKPIPVLKPISNLNVCQNDSILIVADLVTNGSYFWTFNNQAMAENSNTLIIKDANSSNVGNYNVKVTVTVEGCQSNEIDFNVDIRVKPEIVENSFEVCEGNQALLQANPIAGGIYDWKRNGTSLSNSGFELIIPNAKTADAGDYEVKVTKDGCESDPKNLVLNVKDKLVISGNNLDVCLGDAINLQIDGIIGASYGWTGPDSFVSSEEDPVINNSTLVKSGIYKVIATLDGCKSNELEINVTIEDCECTVTDNTISLSQTDYCGDQNNITITGAEASPAGGVYKWETSIDGIIFTDLNIATKDITISTLGKGKYYYKRSYIVTTPEPCSDVSDVITINVNEKPELLDGQDVTICEGLNTELKVNKVNGAEYLWQLPDGTTSTEKSEVLRINNVKKADAGIYKVTANIGTCQSATQELVLTVSEKLLIAGNDLTVCEGSNAELSVTDIPGAIYTWNNGISSTSAKAEITNATSNVEYTVSADLNGCKSDAIKLKLNVSQKPTISGNDISVCENDNGILKVNDIPGATYTWTNVSSSNGSEASVNNVSANGDYTVIAELNSCKSDVLTLKVNMKPQPSISGNDVVVCSGDKAILSVNDIPGAKYTWDNGISSNTSSVEVIAPGVSTTYNVFAELNSCKSQPITLNLTVTQKPVLTGSDVSVCQGENATLKVNDIANATYIWTNVSISDGSEAKVNNVTINGSYTVVASIGSCKSEILTLNVIAKEIPALSIAPVSELCIGDTAVINATTSNGASITWSGLFTGTTEDIVINGATLAQSGIYTAIASLNGCSSKEESISLNIIDCNCIILNNIITPSNDSYCGIQNNVEIKGTSAEPSEGNYSWEYSDNGINFNSIGAADKQDLTVSSLSVGKHYYRRSYTTTSGVICSNNSSIVSIEIKEQPTVEIFPLADVCEGKDVIINATVSNSAAIINWSGPDGFTSQNEDISLTNVNLLKKGKYTISVDLNGCIAQKEVNLNVKNCNCDISLNSINNPTQLSYCEKAENITLTGNEANPIGGIYEWQYSKDGGAFDKAGTNANQKDYFIASLPVGNHKFRRIYVKLVAPVCSDTSNITEITVSENKAVADIEPISPVCEGGEIKLSSTEVAGAIYNWTGPNNFISSERNPIILNAKTSDLGNYKLTVSLPGCDSKSDDVDIIVKPKPGLQVSDNVTECEGNDFKLNAISIAGAKYNWSLPNGTTESSSEINVTTANITDSGKYTVSVEFDGCKSDLKTIEVKINPIPTTPIATSTGPFCEGNDVLLSTAFYADAKYKWTGPNNFNASVHNPTIQDADQISNGQYKVVITRNNNSCQSEPGTVDVVINKKPETPEIILSQSICEGKDLLLETKTNAGPDTKFFWEGPNGFKSEKEKPEIVAITKADEGEYKLRIEIDGCSSETASAQVLVKDCSCVVDANNIDTNDPKVYCNVAGLFTVIGGEASPNGGKYSWEYSTDSINYVPAQGENDATDYGITNLEVGTHYFRRIYTLSNGSFCSDTSNVIIAQVNQNKLDDMEISLEKDIACIGDTVEIDIINNLKNVKYQWSSDKGIDVMYSNGKSASVISSESGKFFIHILQQVEGCEDVERDALITIMSSPRVTLGYDTTFCKLEGEYELNAGDGFASYLWEDGSTTPSITISETGKYRVTVTDENGCAAYDEVAIKEFCCQIFYPNIVKLSSIDNKEFKLSHSGCVIESKLRIFDRWGNMVYTSNEGLEAWDGKLNGKDVETGVYTFIFNYKALDENDVEFSNKLAGDVTLIK